MGFICISLSILNVKSGGEDWVRERLRIFNNQKFSALSSPREDYAKELIQLLMGYPLVFDSRKQS